MSISESTLSPQASRLVFGGASLSGLAGGYGFGPILEDDLIEYAIDCNIRVFDTAPIYGWGHSEIILGQKLLKHRHTTKVITKGGITWTPQKRVYIDNSPKVLTRMIEESMKRLQRDCIDIYFLHWPCSQTPLEDSINTLIHQKKSGKIAKIGLSHFPACDIRTYINVIDYVQWEYNVFSHKVVDDTILPLKNQGSFQFIATSVLDRGILAGAAQGPFPTSDFRRKRQHWNPEPWKYKTIEEWKQKGIHPLDHALSFVFDNPSIDYAAIGFRKKSHIDDAIISIR